MEALTAVVLVWLMLLSIGLGGLAFVGLRTRSMLRNTYAALQQRTAEVQLQDRMNDLLAKLDRYDLAKHRELRAAVELFITQCEGDPIVRDRMWRNLEDLKHRLK
jgi:uncharacterized protein HemX